MSTVTIPELSAANMTADPPTCTTSQTGALTLGENCDSITGELGFDTSNTNSPLCAAATSNSVPESRIVDGNGIVVLAICMGDVGVETSKTTNRPSPVPTNSVLPDSANALTGMITLPISTGDSGLDASTIFKLSASPKNTVVPETWRAKLESFVYIKVPRRFGVLPLKSKQANPPAPDPYTAAA